MIRLMKNTFYKESETKEALIEFIRSAEKLSMSDQCLKFESNFAKWQGRKFATFVANGSAANLALLQSLLNLGRIKKGDKVGFSAVTWPTNVMPIIQLGLIPIPIDCEIETINVSSKTVNEAYEATQFKILFITNALGFCSDLNEIANYCSDKQILLIEDNCESLGSVHAGKKLGNFGLASTFSTFVGHHMSTIEGGFVCTDDEELNEHLIMTRAHGWDRNLPATRQKLLRENAHVDDFYSTYTFYELAFNIRPTEIQGFIGNQQIQYLDEMVEKRQKNFSLFMKYRSEQELHSLRYDHMNLVSNFALPLIFKNADSFKKSLNNFIEHKVEVRPIIGGNMLTQPFYKKHVDISKPAYSLEGADIIHNQGFYFGNHPDLDENELNVLCSLLESN